MGNPATKLAPSGRTDQETDPGPHSQVRETARLFPRASVSLEIGVSSEHNFWSGITMNVSEGGVFIATHHDVPMGTVLSVSLTLPDGGEPVVALGEVRWARPYTGNADAPPGLGVGFVDISEAALSRVRRFVKAVRDPLYFED
jgi:uncharacterized protein (TIGR02266 family)